MDPILGMEDEDPGVRLEVAEGNGPVNALAKALFRALLPQFPSLQNVVLSDYKVIIIMVAFTSQVSYEIREILVKITLRSAGLLTSVFGHTGAVAYAIQLLSTSIVSVCTVTVARTNPPCVV